MTRVLLTGGSGFIGAHILQSLIAKDFSVVTTVRSQEKAQQIRNAYPNLPASKLDFSIVPDIAKPDAFDQAVVSSPPFSAVIHSASPFHFNVTDVQKELLDPAVMGTTGILKSIKKNAPTVKRVAITSSFAAMINADKGLWPEHTYSEADWNPVTQEQAVSNPSLGYRASKTFAEKAAWDFVAQEKPNFTISTLNPPLVIGPIVHHLASLDGLNTSNQRTRDCMLGKWKDEIPETGVYGWIDVRDIALAHVLAIERPEAANKRFFVTSGFFDNAGIAKVVRENFKEYTDVPGPNVPGGHKPAEMFKFDNTRAKELLGKFTPFETSIIDLVKSLKAVGA